MNEKIRKCETISKTVQNCMAVHTHTHVILKGQKGITLVGLVITIIVLLILAGVSLNLVMGEEGIIGRVIEASKMYDISGAKEQVEMLAAKYVGEFYSGKYITDDVTYDKTGSYVASKFIEEDKIGKYTLRTEGRIVQLKNDKNIALGKINDDGSIQWGQFWICENDENGHKIVTDGIQDLKVGDSVDYNPQEGAIKTTETSYKENTGTSSNQLFKLQDYNYGWRVLGADENSGQVLLMAEEQIKQYSLDGRLGYKNGIDELNKISALYGQGKYATGARSINEEDINKITGYVNKTYIYKFYWTGLNSPIYEIGKTTAKLYNSHSSGFFWFDENSKNWKKSMVSETASENMPEKITELTSNYYSYNIFNLANLDDNVKEMLIGKAKVEDGKTTFLSNSGKTINYWIASKYTNCSTANVKFSIQNIEQGTINLIPWMFLYGSDGSSHLAEHGVIPVVYLKNDIHLEYNSETQKWDFVEKSREN